MVIRRSGNLYSLYSPGNHDYQKSIHFYLFFSSKNVEIDYAKIVFVLELVVILMNGDIIKLIYV